MSSSGEESDGASVMGGLGETVGKTFQGSTRTFGNVVSGLGATISGATEGVGQTVTGAAEGLGTTASGLGQTVNKGIIGDKVRKDEDEADKPKVD
ncbi:hypothetical protein PMG11_09271 [Penicillium brasilianum]|uniref:Uncharacterized protein n=1 Tax=Penicillium brasilianum TaxID=104259 RepID=A0A0F7TVG4_PENBI|nr:hypothetical protein PMG11_09271 [Penicillium brasilianum]